ncbi:MAG: proliferating cell nuclear antigen (pcna) [Candidatus Pacearchaeota archaeon]
MLIRLENPKPLSRVIDIISDLVTEVRIKVDDSGFSITAMDPANVALVNFVLPKNSFTQFEADTEVLGVNLESLKGILKRCGTTSTLTLEKKENILNIGIQDRIKRDFKLSLIEIDSEEKEMPKLEFAAEVELASQDLSDSIEDCLVVADACSFKIKDKKFVVEAKGLNSARSEFSEDEARIHAEDCKSRYSLEYLQKFIKGAKLSGKTILKFANDHPLRMDIKNDFLELSFLLAPRVETED